METSDFGYATITFKNYDATHDVIVPFTFAVNVADLDVGELAWEAAELWPESGWGTDHPKWSVVAVTVTVDGVTTTMMCAR